MAYEREPVESPRQNVPQVPEAAVVDRHPLYNLQGYAGNMAVSRLVQVQRQDMTAGPADDPLTAAEVADALTFYRRQPTLYTRQVIQDLRTRLSLDPAGGIDADLAQAVA